jgi:hypothetical protein
MKGKLWDKIFDAMLMVSLFLVMVYLGMKIPDIMMNGFEHQNIDALYVSVDKCDIGEGFDDK